VNIIHKYCHRASWFYRLDNIKSLDIIIARKQMMSFSAALT
jgi:hypothetical protein